MHYHIWSFCGEPGCRDRSYHPNTENLVSPQLTSRDVATYFADRADEDTSEDEYVITVCASDSCPNPESLWLYILRDDPLTRLFRPDHYDSSGSKQTGSRSGKTWAHAWSMWSSLPED